MIALLALAAPAAVGAKGHKPDRNGPPAHAPGSDRDRDDDDCDERARPKRKHRGRGADKPASKPKAQPRRGSGQRRDDDEDCDPGGGPGTGGGDRAFGEGTTSGLSFRFDASSGPNGENPNPSGSEEAFVQFRDASGQIFAGPVRCLTVVGNQAVIGFDNQEPETPDIDVILFVEDNAASASPNRFDAEATVSPDSCPSPRTPFEAVTSGDITVQDNTAGGGGGGGGGGHGDDDEDDEHGDDDAPGDDDDEHDEDEDDDYESDYDDESSDDESDDDDD